MHYYDYVESYRNLARGQYDLVDLQFDNPRLFSRIIEDTLWVDRDKTEVEVRNKQIAELRAINRLIIETSNELLGLSKAKVLNVELNRIKTEFYWQNIKTDEKVETMFWRDCYDGFVSFMRKMGKPKMTDIFDLDVDEIKEAGFSTHYIKEIVSIFEQWADRLLTTEANVSKIDDESMATEAEENEEAENDEYINDVEVSESNQDTDTVEKVDNEDAVEGSSRCSLILRRRNDERV